MGKPWTAPHDLSKHVPPSSSASRQTDGRVARRARVPLKRACHRRDTQSEDMDAFLAKGLGSRQAYKHGLPICFTMGAHPFLQALPHEETRLSLLRPLVSRRRLADPHCGRHAAAIHRTGGRGRADRHRRCLLPRPPLRPPAGLALPAAGRHRRAHPPHRDRHCRHQHALREPAVHGGRCRRRRPDRRRPPAAGHQPRLARTGH